MSGRPLDLPQAPRTRLAPSTVASLAAVYIVWSSTYLALRYVVEDLPPLLSAGSRYATAGAILYVFLRLRGAPRPTAMQWILSIPVGALLFLVGNGFIAIAELRVSSGLAAISCAAMPLFLALFGAFFAERPSRREWIGLGVGFSGVIVLRVGDLGASFGSAALLVLAPAGWALGSMASRKLALPAGTMAAATPMIAGGVVTALVGFMIGEAIPSHAPARALLAWGYLVVFGSIVTFSGYMHLLRTTRPAVATSYAYVNPILAVVLGVAIRSEPIGPWLPLAGALVVAGVALVISARGKSPPNELDGKTDASAEDLPPIEARS
jgi:drug/metabolite transporter (DMT)-like permease